MRPASIVCAALAAALACTWAAADVPDWMRAQADLVIPPVTDDSPAVLLHSETVLTVKGPGKLERLDRRVYRILRREGEAFGSVRVDFDSLSPVTRLRGWSIPPQGKPYEVGERDTLESGLDTFGSELITDLRSKLLRIPAAQVGSVIGYEYVQQLRPYAMMDEWDFQETVPVRQARYTLQVPPGWSYKVNWLNYPEQQPAAADGAVQWSVSDLKRIALERMMPPWRGIAGRMAVALVPPQGQQGGFQSWRDVGTWYLDLTRGRRDATPEIAQKVRELTGSKASALEKIQALVTFVQRDIRYVAIELGIGGVQPHPAAEVFAHRYGDCKDKVTLLSSMLKEIGVDSHYVIINTARGSVTQGTPPNLGFNHAIIAIQMPSGSEVTPFPAAAKHPALGSLLYFDPTQPLIPFGHLPGSLQANFGMLVTPAGGELQQLPKATPEVNGVTRTAKLVLDDRGTLRGDVVEIWRGDVAAGRRAVLRSARQQSDQIKPLESMLAHALSAFKIEKSDVVGSDDMGKPLEWRYTLAADRYAKTAGDLLLIRPRVLGDYSDSFLDPRKPRQHAIEFDALERNTDVFEITLPPGYALEEVPPPVNSDTGFASYRSGVEVKGNVLRYTRHFELKELSIPAAQAEKLDLFYRTIFQDERMTAVLAPQ